jgi:5-methylcytosine-specific restriction protein A
MKRQQPLCVKCLEQGRVREWTQLDHKRALTNGGTYEDSNLQGLCDECHDAKTREDLGHKPSGRCDANGMPIDPNHPWNAAG